MTQDHGILKPMGAIQMKEMITQVLVRHAEGNKMNGANSERTSRQGSEGANPRMGEQRG